MGPSIPTIQCRCLRICSIEFGSRDLIWVEGAAIKVVSCFMWNGVSFGTIDRFVR